MKGSERDELQGHFNENHDTEKKQGINVEFESPMMAENKAVVEEAYYQQPSRADGVYIPKHLKAVKSW